MVEIVASALFFFSQSLVQAGEGGIASGGPACDQSPRCPTVTVSCSGLPSQATFDRATCTITLSSDTCTALGRFPGDEVDPNEEVDLTRCLGATNPYYCLSDSCLLAHELGHAKYYQRQTADCRTVVLPESTTDACDEQYGFGEHVECLANALTLLPPSEQMCKYLLTVSSGLDVISQVCSTAKPADCRGRDAYDRLPAGCKAIIPPPDVSTYEGCSWFCSMYPYFCKSKPPIPAQLQSPATMEIG
jgi:hypothetical protein